MYRPSKQEKHNKYLSQFIRLFNRTSPKAITAEEESERYIRDGLIILRDKAIGFDFEVRDDWNGDETGGVFLYRTLAQFERKFDPEKEIELTIQFSRDGRWFVVAWHRDFKESIDVERQTNYDSKEKGRMRVTEHYTTFHWTQLEEFKQWVSNFENL